MTFQFRPAVRENTPSEWRTIHSYSEYEASDAGQIRRATPGRDGRPPTGRPLAPQEDKRGYLWVNLRVGGNLKHAFAHRLVCEAFHGSAPTTQHQVAHGNGVRDDNRPDNLRWCMPKENSADRLIHGTAPIGARHGRAKLTEEQVIQIRSRYRKGRGNGSYALAKEFGIHPYHLRLVAIGTKWGHM